MKVTKRLAQIALAVVILGVAISIFTPLRFLNRDEYRAQVRRLFDELQAGATRQDVRQMLASARYPDLRLRPVDDQKWLAEAPYEFGAGSWILVIEFDHDRVAAARVRTHDGLHHHPAAAPPDKIFPAPQRSASTPDPAPSPCVPVASLPHAPRKTRHVSPEWKSIADVRTQPGALEYEITIDPSGKVAEVRRIRRARRGSPAEKLWEVNEAAIAQWEFEPSTMNGQPVSVCMVVTVTITV